mmetsp:Transcript_70817/g.188273  ORF Transcript_70817/g.188273 Transcript_70817/m.188273 type:complete len:287 (-) Transcript_70817:358-1218(-)
MTLPSSNLRVTRRLLSSWRRSTRASRKRGLAAKSRASLPSTLLPKPDAQPGSLSGPAPSSTALPPPTAAFRATRRRRACSRSRIRASGYLASTGITTWRVKSMQWTCVAAVTLAVRRSRRSRTPISPKRSFSKRPRNSPQDVTSTAPRSNTYISSQWVSPSCMMILPGRYQRGTPFMASSATKSCIAPSPAKKGTFFRASHCTACCSKLMSSLESTSLPSSMSFAFMSLWNLRFSRGYFSRMEWKVLRKTMATSHFCTERIDAVRRLSMLSSAASPTMEPSRSLQM